MKYRLGFLNEKVERKGRGGGEGARTIEDFCILSRKELLNDVCKTDSFCLFITRSVDTVPFFFINFEITACLDFSEGISTVKILYHHGTGKPNNPYTFT